LQFQWDAENAGGVMPPELDFEVLNHGDRMTNCIYIMCEGFHYVYACLVPFMLAMGMCSLFLFYTVIDKK